MTPKTNPKTVCHSKRGKENVDKWSRRSRKNSLLCKHILKCSRLTLICACALKTKKPGILIIIDHNHYYYRNSCQTIVISGEVLLNYGMMELGTWSIFLKNVQWNNVMKDYHKSYKMNNCHWSESDKSILVEGIL